MLFLTRKPGQSITIHPQPSLNPDTPVARIFEAGPIVIQLAGVRGFQARIGVEAHAGLCILREELQPLPAVAGEGLGESPRRVVARKLKVLRFLARHSPESLAVAAGVPVERVLAAEGEGGVLELDDLEKLARVLGVKVAELFRAVGRTPEERVLLGVLEGEG